MRKPTPNIMDELMPAKSETTELRAGLKWDYSQLGEAASEVMGHAIEIKRVEKRASEAIVEAGRHLIAVKQSLSHGQWEDWLQTEFAMSDRTARRMMAVAEQFDGKTDTVSVLGPSVLYLLAGDSVPEPAREAVIDLAKSGETVTKAQAQAVINQHKPSRPTPGERYLAGLPALNMTTPTATPAGTYSTPLGNLPKNPIEDWELEDIVEQAATEYYGSVTAAQGEEMAQQSRAHAGEYWAKLQRVLAPFDVSVERVEAAVAAAVERLVGERRALRPGSPDLTKEIKSATWGDQLLKQPQRYAEVWELERLLAQWAQSLDASVLRSTARLRGGAQWWEARKALQTLTSLNYRDRDLVSALHNLANQKDAQAAAETITDPVKGIVVDGDQPLPGWVDADAKQRTIDAAKRIAEAGASAVAVPSDAEKTLEEHLLHVVGLHDPVVQERILKSAMQNGSLPAQVWDALACYTDVAAVTLENIRYAARAAYMRVLRGRSESAAADDEAPQSAPQSAPIADDRRTRLSQYAAQFEATLAALRDWAQLTGRFTLTSEAERGLHRVLEATRSELAALNGQPHQVWGEETTI